MNAEQLRMARQMETVPVEYIGEKPTKEDTVTHSAIKWQGKGDVQMVPRAIAQRLLVPQYEKIWRLHMGDAPPAPPSAPPRTGKAASPPPGAPKELEPATLEQVVTAIGETLSGKDASAALDKEGKPDREALEKHLKRAVSAELRDAAWNAVINAEPAR